MGLPEQQDKKAGQGLLDLWVCLGQQDYLVPQVFLAETAQRVNLEYLVTQVYQASIAKIFIQSLKIHNPPKLFTSFQSLSNQFLFSIIVERSD